MPYKPTTPCNRCGKLMWTGTTSLPPGKARCRPCRRIERQPTKAVEQLGLCRWCAERLPNYWSKRYCSRACANRAANDARRIRTADDPHIRRNTREAAAPGLTPTARRALLMRWRTQRRTCTYCDQLATTIDHVVPLIRGGTNYEGNLTPCCKRCNSSKSGWLIIEWRTGLRLPPMHYPLRMRAGVERQPTRIMGQQLALNVCPQCSAMFSPDRKHRIYCTATCQLQANLARQNARNRAHRAANPIPPRIPRHGTTNEYRQGCRCDPCRAAKADANRAAKRQRKRVRGPQSLAA